MTDIPSGLRYSRDHIWVGPTTTEGVVRVGVTDFAQDSLGDVVEVTLPALGETVRGGMPCGEIESTKSVNDLVAPVSGTVTGHNNDLADDPAALNTDPYGTGWLFEAQLDPADAASADLLDADAYRDLAGA